MTEMERYQSISLEDFKPMLQTCIQCYCGLCIEGCPVYRTTLNEAYTARGLHQIALALLEGQLTVSELSDLLIYSCTGCRWCEWNCSLNRIRYIQEHGNRLNKVSGATVAEILRAIKVESGNVPPIVRDLLNNIRKFGNPYGISRSRKDKWVEELKLKCDGCDTILYVGTLVPFENRATSAANALIELLKRGGLKFCMLGGEELESGFFARACGEEGLFTELVERVSRVFKENKIKRIICFSPHDYDTFKNYYNLGDIEIQHYTQVLWKLIEAELIRPTKEIRGKVVYHDPCYLGRRQGVYEEPRKILKSIPGLELVEVREWRRERSWCCGGGGVGLFYDVGLNMNLIRADQIKETGAELVAVACPICRQMIDDAMKSRGYKIKVMDIAEIVYSTL